MTKKAKVRKELDLLHEKVERAWREHEKDPDHEDKPLICPGAGLVGRCTDTAAYLADRLGGEVYGYEADSNPTAIVGEVEGGHDFAVVDDRWLLDFWAQDTYQYPDLYDLDDPMDALEVERMYGPRSKWIRMGPEHRRAYRSQIKSLAH